MTFFLGLTGGIATGKSTADAFFRKSQIPVIDADKIAHELMNPGKASYQAIVSSFGTQVLNADQTINRKKLGQLVFNDSVLLDKLNQLTHPLIINEIKLEMDQYQKQKTAIVVVDLPLLFEIGFEQECDASLVITVPQQLQLTRLMQRNHLTKSAALSRIKSQMPLSEKEKMATYVVKNTGTIGNLEKQLSDILLKIGR